MDREPMSDASELLRAPGQAHWPVLTPGSHAARPSWWECIRQAIAKGYDPELLPSLGFFLLPAIAFAVQGDLLRAGFFAHTAIYLVVLKWLGWAVLGRQFVLQPAYLLFPMEIF